MRHTYITCTDRGNVRQQNEDSVDQAANEAIEAELFCVADGMGGYGSGDVASSTVVQALVQAFVALKAQDVDIPGPSLMSSLFSQAQSALYALKKNQGMTTSLGTTLSAIVFIRDRVLCANIGDSRIYGFDGRSLIQKSRDHTVVNDLVASGSITPEQARNHPRRHVLTRAITGESVDVEPHILDEPLDSSTVYLICSDGLYNMVEEDYICSVLRQSSIFEARDILLKQACANGGKDNITFQIIRPFDGEMTTL
ncbi:MAG: protein phosphatase 2C domain-containing protein [Pseudomonadota bacterium]